MPEEKRGVASCPSTQQEVQLFGSYGVPGTPSTWPSFAKLIETTWSSGGGPIRMWSVSGRGRGRQRFDAGAALSPLPRAQISEHEGSFSVRPLAKLAIAVADMAAAQQPLVIDADQTIELYAGTISVALLVPLAVDNVADPRTALSVAAGELAVDELVGCRIVGIDTSVGARDAVLTTYLYAAANEVAATVVPRSAVEVEVSAAQADAGAWSWQAGDPTALTSSTTLGLFTPGAPERVPSATHLSVAAAGANRFFTLTWKIRA